MEMHKSINTKLAVVRRSINESEKYLAENVILPALYDAISKHVEAKAIEKYKLMKNLELEDYPFYAERVLDNVVEEITLPKNKLPLDFTNLLEFICDDAENPEDKILSYYVFMANAILADNGKFKRELPKFKQFIKNYQGEKLSDENYWVSKFKIYFGFQKEDMKALHSDIRELVLKAQGP
jgi:DNA-binding protein